MLDDAARRCRTYTEVKAVEMFTSPRCDALSSMKVEGCRLRLKVLKLLSSSFIPPCGFSHQVAQGWQMELNHVSAGHRRFRLFFLSFLLIFHLQHFPLIIQFTSGQNNQHISMMTPLCFLLLIIANGTSFRVSPTTSHLPEGQTVKRGRPRPDRVRTGWPDPMWLCFSLLVPPSGVFVVCFGAASPVFLVQKSPFHQPFWRCCSSLRLHVCATTKPVFDPGLLGSYPCSFDSK